MSDVCGLCRSRKLPKTKDLEEGDCGEYLERILTGVLSELEHESAKILLDDLFMLSDFHLKVLTKLVCML